MPRTANEYVLPVMAVPLLSFSVIINKLVVTLGAVTRKLKLRPPLAATSVGDPLPLGPYTGVLKSDGIAIAAPAASSAVTTHEITSLVRTYVVPILVWPRHDSVDAAVADVTLNVNVLPVIGSDPLVSFSVIWKDAVATLGAVTMKLKLSPPFTADRIGEPVPLGPYTGTAKSVLSPVVAPVDVITYTVHDRISLIRITVLDPLA